MLGTVQFGLDYGISNENGKTSHSEIKKILDLCKQEKIDFIDTAPAYGDSEVLLGKLSGNYDFNYISKVPYLNDLDSNIIDIVNTSLSKLNRRSMYGLLFHDSDSLLEKKGFQLYEQALSLKNKKLVKKIGVSAYTKEQIEKIIKNFEIDILQIPINILDQRLLENNFLNKIKNRGVEIHCRSVFLQGLLTMPHKKIHNYFNPIKPILEKLDIELDHQKASKVAAAISFVKQIKEIDRIIIGVNNVKQLKEVIAAYYEKVNINFDKFNIHDSNFIDPRNWKQF